MPLTRAILAASGSDAIVVDGLGPLPAVTTDEDGVREAIAGGCRGYAHMGGNGNAVRDRAAVSIAVYLDRLASDATPKLVLRDDVQGAIGGALNGIGLLARDVNPAIAAVEAALAALPGLTATEESR